MTFPVVANNMVVALWAEGRDARNHKSTLKAIDGDLYSYNVKIGRRTEGGQCVVVDKTAAGGCFHSQTTSCHVGVAKRHADMVMHPLVWAASPLSNEGAPF
jgi:hypothetical protein